jgi:hypothetical protein
MRDVFQWRTISHDYTMEKGTIDFFDVYSGTYNDQLDFSMLGKELVAEVYDSASDSGGAFVVYANEAARAAGNPSPMV